MAFALDVSPNDRQNIIFIDAFDMERAGGAAALNERKNRILVVASASHFDASLSPDIGFIDLDNPARSAHRRKLASAHRFPDAVSKEPDGFHASAKGALKLASADAFLGRAKQIDRLKPDVQLDVARLENGPHANGEGLRQA